MDRALYQIAGKSTFLLIALGVHLSVLVLLLSSSRPAGAIESPVASISMNLETMMVIEEKLQGDIEGKPDPRDAQEPPPLVAKPKPEIKTEPDSEPEPPKAESTAKLEQKSEKKPPKKPREKKLAKERKVKKGQIASVNAEGKRIRGARKAAMKGPRSSSTGSRTSLLRQAHRYAARVRARIARYRPRGGRVRGKTLIGFALTTSGALHSARVSRSCGIAQLDRAALAAVRRAAPFPRPPSGLTTAQLRFVIPFNFR